MIRIARGKMKGMTVLPVEHPMTVSKQVAKTALVEDERPAPFLLT